MQQKNPLYWKLLVYEVLVLWCALSNVSENELNIIVDGTKTYIYSSFI